MLNTKKKGKVLPLFWWLGYLATFRVFANTIQSCHVSPNDFYVEGFFHCYPFFCFGFWPRVLIAAIDNNAGGKYLVKFYLVVVPVHSDLSDFFFASNIKIFQIFYDGSRQFFDYSTFWKENC